MQIQYCAKACVMGFLHTVMTDFPESTITFATRRDCEKSAWNCPSEQPCILTLSNISPCKCSDTDQVVEIPETDQGIRTAGGKIVTGGIKLNADAVGWVGIQHMLKLQVRVAEIAWQCNSQMHQMLRKKQSHWEGVFSSEGVKQGNKTLDHNFLQAKVSRLGISLLHHFLVNNGNWCDFFISSLLSSPLNRSENITVISAHSFLKC